MINILLDDVIGRLHSSKWAKMTKVHKDTALRGIPDTNEVALLPPQIIHHQHIPMPEEQLSVVDVGV